jgi:hypothetical protein
LSFADFVIRPLHGFRLDFLADRFNPMNAPIPRDPDHGPTFPGLSRTRALPETFCLVA